MISVRRTNDIYQIKELHKKLLPSDHLPTIDDNNVYWFAHSCLKIGHGKIAGFAILRVIENGKTGFLCRAGVFQRYSGKGVQRRLIKVRERYALRHGIKEMVTYTSIRNNQSISNLIKCGYRLYTPSSFWAGEDALYFHKKLNA